jgi:ABC-2 type transport system ATP-binding protein
VKSIIITDKLSKYYGKGGVIKAVDDLDLEVYEGETFGLLGPNGAGKTTTVRLLNCIIKPTRGTATVKGFDILKQENDVKRVTGLLAESPGLYEKLSAYEFLEFMGALYDVSEEILPKRIDDLLKLFSLHDRRDYLLEGYLMVKDLIKKLADSAGKTIFICSHILPVVEELCDRIGIINQGRLIGLGTVDEIISQTGTETLEEAFIAITGGVDEKELLAWRNHRTGGT